MGDRPDHLDIEADSAYSPTDSDGSHRRIETGLLIDRVEVGSQLLTEISPIRVLLVCPSFTGPFYQAQREFEFHKWQFKVFESAGHGSVPDDLVQPGREYRVELHDLTHRQNSEP